MREHVLEGMSCLFRCRVLKWEDIPIDISSKSTGYCNACHTTIYSDKPICVTNFFTCRGCPDYRQPKKLKVDMVICASAEICNKSCEAKLPHPYSLGGCHCTYNTQISCIPYKDELVSFNKLIQRLFDNQEATYHIRKSKLQAILKEYL